MEKKHVLDYLDKTHQRKNLGKLFRIVFDHTLAVLGKDGDYEVSLSLIGDKEMHEMDLKYRNVDRPTDVLTFAFEEADFVKDEPIVDLGSILIDPTVARRQAKTYSHPFERELCFLFIHGLLHSFGYDHHRGEKEAEEMFGLQNRILDSLPYDFYTDVKKLKKLLLSAQKGSYSPYSHFRVGAVVVTKDGKYHTGFNIENSAYPVTVCAERCALFRTYAEGYRKEDIAALGCITDAETVGTCCGSCRQVMSELMEMDSPVYIYNRDETKSLITTVRKLLPYTFTPEDLKS